MRVCLDGTIETRVDYLGASRVQLEFGHQSDFQVASDLAYKR